jgi:hypothetical protein
MVTLECDELDVDPYDTLLSAPQRDEPKPLDTGRTDVRSVVPRDGRAWFVFATSYVSGGNFDSVRWYEIANGACADAGELREAGAFYCLPAVMVNRDANVRMAVSRSGATEHPSIHYAGWPTSGLDANGVLFPGAGTHRRCHGDQPCTPDPASRNCWGDCNAGALDPTDEMTVWLCGAVAVPKDPLRWQTWIAAVR